ncbi:MAG: SDR family oxidoreductase, partial [Pseudomonadota bacterium]
RLTQRKSFLPADRTSSPPFAQSLGGALGIGRAIVERFVYEGAAQVIIADIADEVATELADRLGTAAMFRHTDVKDTGAIADLYAFIERDLGGLDVQVSNAGATTRMNFLDMTLDFWEHMQALNLRSVFLSGQAAAKLMIKSGRRGSIVNMASVSGQQGGYGRAAYGATKAGIINLTQVMAAELAAHDIRVNAIAPAAIRVGGTEPGAIPGSGMISRLMMKRYGETHEVTGAALYLAGDDSTYTTGSTINVDGGFSGGGVLGET